MWIGPLLGAVQDAKDFYPLASYPINGDEGRTPNDQLASSLHAALASDQRMTGQPVGLTFYFCIESGGRAGTVLGNIIQLLKPGVEGSF